MIMKIIRFPRFFILCTGVDSFTSIVVYIAREIANHLWEETFIWERRKSLKQGSAEFSVASSFCEILKMNTPCLPKLFFSEIMLCYLCALIYWYIHARTEFFVRHSNVRITKFPLIYPK